MAARAAGWSGPFAWTPADDRGYSFLLAHDTRLKTPEAPADPQ